MTIIDARGNVIGIGRTVFNPSYFHYRMPIVSFMVAKNTSGIYTATCLELAKQGKGKSPVLAINDMQEHIKGYIDELFANLSIEDVWKQLRSLFTMPMMVDLWNKYRDFEIDIAERQDDYIRDLREVYFTRVIDYQGELF